MQLPRPIPDRRCREAVASSTDDRLDHYRQVVNLLIGVDGGAFGQGYCHYLIPTKRFAARDALCVHWCSANEFEGTNRRPFHAGHWQVTSPIAGGISLQCGARCECLPMPAQG